MGGELGLNGTQEPDFGGNLRGQIGERDRWMVVSTLAGSTCSSIALAPFRSGASAQ